MTAQTKKLIEVALPLPEINDASAYDKMPGIGPHPKGIHLWWARLPLPAARAVLFSSIVDDPSSHPDKFPTEEAQSAERERLFGIVRDLMQKKLHEKPEVYAKARAEMLAHCGGKLPEVLDPFSGGGSIPLEAARLGFVAHAADLNPVAVLLNKCNLELVPRRLGQKPINPQMRNDAIKSQISKSGAWGLAEDVRYYGDVIHKRAMEKIGHLYPRAALPKEYGGREANVIAWIWARTVVSPNPAAHGAHVPLISSYWLSTKKGKTAWLEPVIDRQNNTWRFEVKTGGPLDKKAVNAGTKLGRGAKFKCLLTEQPLPDRYIKEQGQAGKIQYRLLAIVAEIQRGRVYLSAERHPPINISLPELYPQESISYDSRYLTPPGYGMTTIASFFTPRQLTSLTTLSDLIRAISKNIRQDAQAAGLSDAEANSYAATVTTFLALALDRCADFNNSLCRWAPSNQKMMNLFGRQAIPMVWDFAEANFLGGSVGAWQTCTEYVADCIEIIGGTPITVGDACQIDAAGTWNNVHDILVSTDPPYYDNVPYAAISDFFYVWLRRTLDDIYPDLFETILTPKSPELVAAPERFDGDKEKAKTHFESGFRNAFITLQNKMDARFPLTVYYAFKQSDESTSEDGEDNGGNENVGNGVDLTTGWETLLAALLGSGFQITATWPVRASQKWRMRSMGSNALASYIVLACRVRPDDAPQCTRRDFLTALKKELPPALATLQQGNIAPVDLAQTAIGPGMAVFSRYAKVVESSGKSMTVRTALALINQILGEVQAEQEAEYDADTRWALAWFEQYGFEAGEFGEAETLSRAKNTTINGLVEAGIVAAGGGKVRLLKREELPEDWNQAADKRRTVWEAAQHLIRALDQHGETGAGPLLHKMNDSLGEMARELAYRLHKICESNGWSAEAQAYNGLVIVWPELTKQAQSAPGEQQLKLKI
ncbi:MAG: DUF1156 domain-containing protein [Deltaproteobacteria bacterium]|jgi:putative DNA methylase|nr:DUF1156 domain-containing protein [Deltaproteobacteria bacterium]